MKKILSLLLLAASLAGCAREADSLSPATLVGTWRLTDRMCYCAASPLPDEVLTFATDQRFQLFRDGTLAADGTYSLSRGPACGETIDRDQLRLATIARTYVPTGAYTVQGQTLVIDQTNGCVSDGPIYTYTRQP
jgi:hypothetical protein